jgi:hypothetical protein
MTKQPCSGYGHALPFRNFADAIDQHARIAQAGAQLAVCEWRHGGQ